MDNYIGGEMHSGLKSSSDLSLKDQLRILQQRVFFPHVEWLLKTL